MSPVWVISDEIAEAKILLQSILPLQTKWVNPPANASPVESLVLMSHASANIIANSTFSWWGAMLNPGSVVTVAPQKWFRGMDDPIDLYPSHWILVPSVWKG
jgi:hypothetical protein